MYLIDIIKKVQYYVTMKCLRRHFDHTISAYLELNEENSWGKKYQLSWNWTKAADFFAGRIEGPAFSSLEKAEKKYSKVMLSNRKDKLSSIAEFKRSGRGIRKLLKAIESSIVVDEKDLYPELYADPMRNRTYLAGKILKINNYLPKLSEPEIIAMAEEISNDYGIVAPGIKLDLGSKKSDEYYGYYSPKENNIYLTTQCQFVFLHEMAHAVCAHLVDPSIATHHGEMFNRVQIKLLDEYTNLDGEEIFEEFCRFDLFRSEIEYEDIIKPLGIISQKPLLEPILRELG